MRIPTAGAMILIGGLVLVPAGKCVYGDVCAVLERQKLTASDAELNDLFGGSVSIDGDWLVVGAVQDSDAGVASGSAYVFRRDDGGTPSDPSDDTWVQQEKLTASDASVTARFGKSVSISGDRMVIGAFTDSTLLNSAGSAYVFRRDDNNTPSDLADDFWVQEDKLTASDAAAGDDLGTSVSIRGDLVIAGAADSAAAGNVSGAAYVFRRDDNGTPSEPSDDFWIEEAKLIGSDTSVGDHFGTSVSVGVGRVLIGAIHDDDGGSNAGAAYVFRRDDNGTPFDPIDDSWVQEPKLLASNGAGSAQFGVSVSLISDRCVVGSMMNSVYVFRLDDNGTPADPSDDWWFEEAVLSASDVAPNDVFGSSVSMSGDRLVAGAPNDDDGGSESGSAYVFRRDDGGTPLDPSDDLWIEEAKLAASDAVAEDRMGNAVSMDGDDVLAGAWEVSVGGAGSAYVFDLRECGSVPTVSASGLAAMLLLAMTAGIVLILRRRASQPA